MRRSRNAFFVRLVTAVTLVVSLLGPLVASPQVAFAAPNGGDITVTWYGAEPGTYNQTDGSGGDSADVVTSLEGEDFACGDHVVFFAVITIGGSAGASTGTFNFNMGWEGANGGQIGFRVLNSITLATGDSQWNADNDNSSITTFSATPTPAVDPDNLVVSVTINDLEAGETIIIKIDVGLVCAETVNTTNIQSSWGGGTVDAGGSGTIGGGEQTFSLQIGGGGGDITYYTPTIVTTVSEAQTQPGGDVTDTAIVSGPVGIPAPAGTVTFFVCGPTASPPDCTTGGTQVGTAVTLVSNTAVSATFAPTAEGAYCFRAVYTPASGSPYNPGNHTNDTTECFTAAQLTGTLTVEKQTLPDGSTQSFTFTPSWGSSFSLSDGGSQTSSPLPAGTYSVSEAVPTGWDLSSAVCSDGSPVNAIELAGGEEITCVFTNTQRGTIIVDKVTNPSGDTTAFTFTPSWGDPFTLTDAAMPHNSGLLVPGIYSVSETVPAGWDLSSATCSDESDPASIDLGPGEVVTCTFTNARRQNLTVSKTATASYNRTYAWTIEKTADTNRQEIAAGTDATFNYTVEVGHDAGTNSLYQVTGTISVTNPNQFAPTTGVVVTDDILGDTGDACVVDPGETTIAAGATEEYAYTCTWATAPADTGAQTNRATVTWTPIDGETASASYETTVTWSEATVTLVDESIDVSDSLEGALGTATVGIDTFPKQFTYSQEFEGVSGTCTDYPNTATFTANDTGATDSDGETVTVCVGANLTVAKTATTAVVRTHTWDITKTADPTSLSLFAGGGAAVIGYTVAVDKTTTDSWIVSGEITVTNPNDWQAIVVTVSDSIPNGGVCTVPGGATVTVPAATAAGPGTLTLAYTCTYAAAPSPTSATNTATATWNATTHHTPTGTASGAATADFGQATITTVGPNAVTVTDTNGKLWGPVSADASWTYSDPFRCPLDPALYAGDGHHQFTRNNTAEIRETGQSATETVTVDCYAPVVSKTAQTSYTRAWTWQIDKTADVATLNLDFWQPGTVTYQVTVTGAPVDSAWAVSGVITVANPNPDAAMTVSLSDVISGGIAATITGDADCAYTSGTLVVPAGATATCPYTAALPNGTARTNTATATLNQIAFIGTAAVTFGAPTSVVDATVTVTDSQQGELGTFTGTRSSPTKAWTYQKQVGPYAACTVTQVVNMATFVTNDTQTSGSDTWTVDVRVRCEAVCDCTRLPSYWLSVADKGTRRGYDRTWDLIGPQGSATTFFESPYSYKLVLLLRLSGSEGVYYTLAQQYIAAELNILQGASVPQEVVDAYLAARSIFQQYTPAQVAGMSSSQKAELQALANTLYRYNMGYIGPGRCR